MRYTLGKLVDPIDELYTVMNNGNPIAAWATKEAVANMSDKCNIMDGVFFGGHFYGGLFEGGAFYGGEFHGGWFRNGAFYGGEFNGGEYTGTSCFGGVYDGGFFYGGCVYGGVGMYATHKEREQYPRIENNT